MHMLMHCSCTCRTDVSRAVLTCFVSITEAALATGQINQPVDGHVADGTLTRNNSCTSRFESYLNCTTDRQNRNSTSLTCHIQLLAVLSRAEPLTPACGRVQIALSRPPNVHAARKAASRN